MSNALHKLEVIGAQEKGPDGTANYYEVREQVWEHDKIVVTTIHGRYPATDQGFHSARLQLFDVADYLKGQGKEVSYAGPGRVDAE